MRRSSRRGYTLIEMVLVALVLSIFMAAVLDLVGKAIEQLQEVSTDIKRGREGPSILSLIEQDLSNAYVDPRMREVFAAEDAGDGTEMRFVTSRNSTMFIGGVQSDLCEVGYDLKRNDLPGTWPLYTLRRREEFAMDKEPLHGGLWIPVADNVVEFSCTFFELEKDEGLFGFGGGSSGAGTGFTVHQAEELRRWKSEDRYLPYAVKIVLKLDIRDEDVRTLETTHDAAIQTFVSFVKLPSFPRKLAEQDDALNLSLRAPLAKPKPGDPAPTPPPPNTPPPDDGNSG